MDRKKFYSRLHNKISSQIGLSVDMVEYIRSGVVPRRQTRLQFIKHLAGTIKKRREKSSKPGPARSRSRKFYHRAAERVAKLSDRQWDILVEPSEHDKSNEKKST